MDASDTKRIVIVGKTGAGRSSLANTMFGKEVFKISHSANSETSKCEATTGSVNGQQMTLVDTPGFFDTDRSEEETKPEIVRCITECSPGPHAFLIVLNVEKYTEQENDDIKKICELFSEEVFRYSIVVFTHGDQLPEGQKIQDFLCHNNTLRDLVKKCGGRCHIVDNKYWNQNPTDKYRSNRFQVEELLKTLNKMLLANNGGCYTNEMLQEVQAKKSGNLTKVMKTGRKSLKMIYYVFRRNAGAITLFGAFLYIAWLVNSRTHSNKQAI